MKKIIALVIMGLWLFLAPTASAQSRDQVCQGVADMAESIAELRDLSYPKEAVKELLREGMANPQNKNLIPTMEEFVDLIYEFSDMTPAFIGAVLRQSCLESKA